MSARSSSVGARDTQKQETRQRILSKAALLCARKGFARTKTADVARAARVSHGSVFVHFPSREELMTAVVSEMAREITDALHARAFKGGSLREVLDAHVECVSEREDQIRWLLLEVPLLPKGFHSAWLGLQSAISFHVAQAAEREMAAGTVKKMPVHLLFNTWVGLVHHYLINRELYAPGGGVLREHGQALLDHFMALVSRAEPTRRRRSDDE